MAVVVSEDYARFWSMVIDYEYIKLGCYSITLSTLGRKF